MKSIILSTLSAWLARVLAIALNIIGIPLALQKLGSSEFGLLLVILSIGSWIGFANIGIGRVIANIVARRRQHFGRLSAEAVSAATLLAAGVNLTLFISSTGLFFFFMSFVQPSPVIADNYREFVVSIVSLFFAFSLWFFLSIFEGIDAGHHQLHRLYLFQLASYALSLAVLLFWFPQHPSISFAAYLLNLGFLLGSVFHAMDVVRRNRTLFTFKFEWRRRVVRLVMLSSFDFVLISLGMGIVYQLATGLFGFIFGPEAIVELGIFMRLVQSYGALVIAFTYPLSNIIASKLKSRDNASTLHTARMSGALLMAGACVGGFGFLLLGTPVLSIWLKSAVHLDRLFLINASLLIVLSALHFYLAALMIGAASIREAARIHIGEAIVFIPLAYALFTDLQQGGALLAMNAVLAAGIVMMIIRLRQHPVLGALFQTPNAIPARAT